MTKKNDEKPTICIEDEKPTICTEETYTCVSCGRNKLKFTEIVYKEDKNGQVDLSTVMCLTCNWLALYPLMEKNVQRRDQQRI